MSADTILNLYWDGFLPVDPAALIRSMGLPLTEGGMGGREPSVQARMCNRAGVRIEGFGEDRVKRFALAHAIGHLALGHVGDGSLSCCRTDFRSNNIDPREAQANRFALDLLIPRRILEYAIAQKGITDVRELSSLFGVSEVAMAVQLQRHLKS